MTAVLEATPSPEPPELTEDEQRRLLVQTTATRTYGRRQRRSKIYLGFTALCLLAAFLPLGDILFTVVRRGLPYISWSFLTTDQELPTANLQNHFGGIAAALAGTVEVFGLALAIAVPIGVCVGIALYESRGRLMSVFRIMLEVLVGMPSILFGVFIFSYVVQKMHYQFTQFSGSLALACLMLPLIAVSAEQALRAVPDVYVEAALALGAKRSTTMRRVVLPHALPRIWTGIMLAGARAVGETAPVLFVIGANLDHSWNPLTQASTLTTLMYNNWSSQPYQAVRNEDWGIALVLITGVLVLNLISRYFVARASRGRT